LDKNEKRHNSKIQYPQSLIQVYYLNRKLEKGRIFNEDKTHADLIYKKIGIKALTVLQIIWIRRNDIKLKMKQNYE
jgi:hypothetical protein